MRALPLSYLPFAAVTVAVAWFAGTWPAGEWWNALVTAAWSPPQWVFLAALPLALLLQGVAAWLAWEEARVEASRGLLAWAMQWPLYLAFNWLLFALHRPGWALPVLAGVTLAGWLAWREFRTLGSQAALPMALCVVMWCVLWAWLAVTWRFSGGGWGSVFG